MSTAIQDALAQVPIFAGLEPRTLERLSARVQVRSVPSGTMLFREGEPCAGFWIVESGSVNVLKIGVDGRVHILEACFPGGIFALVSAVDGGPYPATAETREGSRLLFLARADLLAAIEEAPSLGLAIAAFFATKLRSVTCRAAAVCLQSVRGRLASLIVDEATARGREASDGSVLVRLPAAQEELAQRLGTVREVLARALRSLREEGLITQERDAVSVLDLGRLRRLARM